MRKLILATGLVLLLMVSARTYATDYHWSGGAISERYDCASVWSPSGVPQYSSDLIQLDNDDGGATCILASSTSLPSVNPVVLGAVVIDNGTLTYKGTSGPNWTLRLKADNGQSGDFIIRNSGKWDGYGGSQTIDLDGDFRLRNGGIGQNDPAYHHIVMRGYGSTAGDPAIFDDDHRVRVWKSITVEEGAYVSAGDGTGASPWTRSLLVKGTITGGTWNVESAVGDNSDISFGSGAWTGGELVITAFGAGTAAGATPQYVNLGGGTYPKISLNAPGSYYANQFIRLKGDVTVTSDFSTMKSLHQYAASMNTLLDTDNGSGTVYNLTIDGNVDMDGVVKTGTNHHAGIKGNTATIDINGNAKFGRYAYLKGDTATWKFAGNVQFTSNFRFDNTDMSQATVVVDGSGAQNLDIGSKVALGNVIVNKSGGALTLDDNVLLVGNLSITGAPDSFAITNATDGIIFKGGIDCETLAQTINVGGADLIDVTIAAGSNTYVKLLSDLAVSDNLNIETGCKLFIGEHTLDLTGSDAAAFLGQNVLSGAGVWTVAEGGEIVGALIPEPSTLLLLGTGVLGALGYVRRRRMS